MIKSQQVNLFQKCSEYYNTWSNEILFIITHDESSPTALFYMDASNVMLVSHLIAMEGWIQKASYAPIRIQCVNVSVNNEI